MLQEGVHAPLDGWIRQGRTRESNGITRRFGCLRQDRLKRAKTYKGKEKRCDEARFAQPLARIPGHGRKPSAEYEIAYVEVGTNCKSNFLSGCQITIHFGHTSKRRSSLPRPSRLSAISSDSPLTPGQSRKF